MAKKNSDVLMDLHLRAIHSQKNAYAPYSHFKVGAALITDNHKIFSGCNVENASYGGTICAERSAIFAAVAAEAKIVIQDILVVTSGQKPWPPCGLCRQVIFEFANQSTRIHLANEQKIFKSYLIKELLPEAFGPKSLSAHSK